MAIFKTVTAGMIALVLTGCDGVLDCLDNDGPVFDKVAIKSAVLNEVYAETIRASVNNEPQDQRFDYQFELTGQLPAGVSTREAGQQFLFTGTPTESGSFPLTLFVEVDDGLNAQESGLCYVSETENYVLVVSEI